MSWLKYSIMYIRIGDAPCWLTFTFHVNLTDVSVTSEHVGLVGAPGNAEGSGVRWKIMDGLSVDSMRSAAVQLVSPASLITWHVYNPVSVRRRSEKQNIRPERELTSGIIFWRHSLSYFCSRTNDNLYEISITKQPSRNMRWIFHLEVLFVNHIRTSQICNFSHVKINERYPSLCPNNIV